MSTSTRMQSVLILGGSYFVGPALIRLLRQIDCEVTVLNRGTRPIAGVRQVVGDRNNLADVQRALASLTEVDAVIDLSCYQGEQAAIAYSCLKPLTECWIHLSSAAVYTAPLWPPAYESQPATGGATWSSYGRDKADAELRLRALHRDGRLVILRPAYAYGPRNYVDRETHVWSRALRGRPILVPGDGATPIQLVHVDDLARAVVASVAHCAAEFAIYNIAHRSSVSLREFARLCCDVANSASDILLTRDLSPAHTSSSDDGLSLGARYSAFDDVPMCVSVGSIEHDLGWRAEISLADGLRSTFQTYSAARLRMAPIDTRMEDHLLAPRSAPLRATQMPP